MSADLEIQNGTVSYAQAEGEPAPWWKGREDIKELSRTATRKEWELAANFNFDITMEEMVTLVGDEILKDQERVVRPVRHWRGGPNDGLVDLLGTARTELYGLVTPSQMLDFAETLVHLAKESGITDPYIATLGSVRNGNRNFISVHLGTTSVKSGNGWNDETKLYLSISNSYDGRSPFAISNDDIRIVCSNTQQMVLRNVEKIMKAEKGSLRGNFISGQAVRLKHTTAIHDRIAEAMQAIAEHNNWRVAYEAYASKLMETKITNKQFDEMVKRLVMDDDEGRKAVANERKWNELRSAWTIESKNRSGMNAWSALNAFTYMTSHLSVAKGNELALGKKLELRHGIGDPAYRKTVIDLTDKVNDYMAEKFLKV